MTITDSVAGLAKFIGCGGGGGGGTSASRMSGFLGTTEPVLQAVSIKGSAGHAHHQAEVGAEAVIRAQDSGAQRIAA